MFKLFVTLLRGRNADMAETLTDAAALPILRQQLRDSAAGVETARRAVAMVMAYAERERKSAARIAAQCADLETRALDALTKGRDDLAAEAAGTIAQLEAEADTTARAIATYDSEIAHLRGVLADSEIAHLRGVLADSESRLRDLQRGQRLAIATDHTQRLRGSAPLDAIASLTEAEATLARLQQRQAMTEASRAALLDLSASSSAEAMRDRLAAAGCGAALRPDAAQVLARLKLQTV